MRLECRNKHQRQKMLRWLCRADKTSARGWKGGLWENQFGHDLCSYYPWQCFRPTRVFPKKEHASLPSITTPLETGVLARKTGNRDDGHYSEDTEGKKWQNVVRSLDSREEATQDLEYLQPMPWGKLSSQKGGANEAHHTLLDPLMGSHEGKYLFRLPVLIDKNMRQWTHLAAAESAKYLAQQTKHLCAADAQDVESKKEKLPAYVKKRPVKKGKVPCRPEGKGLEQLKAEGPGSIHAGAEEQPTIQDYATVMLYPKFSSVQDVDLANWSADPTAFLTGNLPLQGPKLNQPQTKLLWRLHKQRRDQCFIEQLLLPSWTRDPESNEAANATNEDQAWSEGRALYCAMSGEKYQCREEGWTGPIISIPASKSLTTKPEGNLPFACLRASLKNQRTLVHPVEVVPRGRVFGPCIWTPSRQLHSRCTRHML